MDGQRRERSRTGTSLLLAASSLFVLCFGACRNDSPDPERFAYHMARAEKALSEGPEGLTVADIELRNAIAVNPDHTDAHILMGQVRVGLGDVPGALFYFEETLSIDPEHPGALASLATALRFRDPERATELVSKAKQIAPTDPRGYVAEAELALQAGRLAEALHAAKRSTELGSNFPEAYDVLGRAHESLYRKSRLLNQPTDTTHLEAATAAFNRYSELQGSRDPWKGRVGIARALGMWPGREAEAREAHADLLRESSMIASRQIQSQVAYEALNFALVKDQVALATATLERLIELNPKELLYWDELARIRETESPGQGGETILALIEQDPNDPEGHLRYTSFLRATQGRQAAVDYLNENAENEQLRPEMLGALIEIYDQVGQTKKRDKALASLEEDFPLHPVTLLSRGRVALKEGDSRTAAQWLRQLTIHEDSSTGQNLLAYAEFAEQNFRATLRAIARAIEINPAERNRLRRLRAHAAYELQDCDQAVANFATLLAQENLEATDRVLLASCLYRLGERGQGRRILRDLIASPNPPPEAAVEFAKRESGNPREAERIQRVLKVALEENRDNPQLITEMARVEAANGSSERARRRLDAAVKKGFTDPELLLLRGQLNLESGKLDAAHEDLAEVYRSRPTLPSALSLLLRTLLELNRNQEAIEALLRADRFGLLGPDRRAMLGELQLVAGDRAGAIQNFTAALNRGSKQPHLRQNLALLLVEEENGSERALKVARALVRRRGNQPETWDLMGYLLLRSGRYVEAERAFRRALSLSADPETPARAASHYRLGLALRALGRDEEAEASIRRAQTLDKRFLEDPGNEPEKMLPSSGEAS